MKDSLFDTKEKREAAIAKLVQLQNDPGWDIVRQVLQANIEIVQDLLLHGIGDEDMQTIKTYRERLASYENLLHTPEKLIEQLSGSKSVEPTVDPFLTVDQLKELRHDAT
jgi:hypothetical protein